MDRNSAYMYCNSALITVLFSSMSFIRILVKISDPNCFNGSDLWKYTGTLQYPTDIDNDLHIKQ